MTIEDIKRQAIKDKVPIVKDDTLTFMIDIIKNNNYTNILELGTAVGYSSISIALINKSINIDTIEKNKESYEKAMSNIESMGLDKQIHVYNVPIEEFIPNKTYDFIFVDAAKAQNENYFNKFINYLDQDGKMLFDNMVFHGMVNNIEGIKNRNTRSLVKKIIKFRETMINKDGFDIILDDTTGDGYMLVSRRKHGL